MEGVVTPTAPPRPALASFWHDLPREARLLLATVVVDALGAGLVLPFGVVYLHEVRDMPLTTVGAVLGVPAVVALLLVGPFGSLIDRFGPRRVQIGALLSQTAGTALLAFVHTPVQAVCALALMGVGQAAFWPASQSLIAAVVPPETRQRYFGTAFTILNAGIGVGGLLSGFLVSVDSPRSFVIIYLVDSVSFLVPAIVLAGPLRHVANAAVHEPGDDAPPPSGSLPRRAARPLVPAAAAVHDGLGVRRLRAVRGRLDGVRAHRRRGLDEGHRHRVRGEHGHDRGAAGWWCCSASRAAAAPACCCCRARSGRCRGP
nr:MFS transporter [Angustibacter aerolatus]